MPKGAPAGFLARRQGGSSLSWSPWIADELIFEWDGKTITKKVDEVLVVAASRACWANSCSRDRWGRRGCLQPTELAKAAAAAW